MRLNWLRVWRPPLCRMGIVPAALVVVLLSIGEQRRASDQNFSSGRNLRTTFLRNLDTSCHATVRERHRWHRPCGTPITPVGVMNAAVISEKESEFPSTVFAARVIGAEGSLGSGSQSCPWTPQKKNAIGQPNNPVAKDWTANRWQCTSWQLLQFVCQKACGCRRYLAALRHRTRSWIVVPRKMPLQASSSKQTPKTDLAIQSWKHDGLPTAKTES